MTNIPLERLLESDQFDSGDRILLSVFAHSEPGEQEEVQRRLEPDLSESLRRLRRIPVAEIEAMAAG